MLKEMKTRKHLKPGQMGTKRLVEQYGASLLCVRDRYNEKRRVMLKTVELIVAEQTVKSAAGYRDDEFVNIVVAYGERSMRDTLKSLGGRWDPQEKLWHIPYGLIRGNDTLEERIIRKQSAGF